MEMKKIKTTLLLVSLMLSACHLCAAGESCDYVDYVNPLMGSQSVHSFSTGNIYPAIATLGHELAGLRKPERWETVGFIPIPILKFVVSSRHTSLHHGLTITGSSL